MAQQNPQKYIYQHLQLKTKKKKQGTEKYFRKKNGKLWLLHIKIVTQW